jgi:hypothetical protein
MRWKMIINKNKKIVMCPVCHNQMGLEGGHEERPMYVCPNCNCHILCLPAYLTDREVYETEEYYGHA